LQAADGVPPVECVRSETTVVLEIRVAVPLGTERTEIWQAGDHPALAACAGGKASMAGLLLEIPGGTRALGWPGGKPVWGRI